MRRGIAVLLLTMLLGACASTDPLDEGPTSPTSPVAELKLEPPVNRAYLPDVRDWRAVDRDYILIWHTPNRPFLIRLQRPLTVGAQSALTMALKRKGTYLTKFDSVVIDRWEYAIDSIWEITREQSDQLTGRGTSDDD